MSRNLRQAIRFLTRRPTFALTVLVLLALGVGVNIAVFSMINAMLLRPLPYGAPERLVAVHERHEKKGLDWESASVPDYEDWQRSARSFAGLAAFARRNYNASSDEQPERLEGCGISVNLFPLLGVRPVLGRNFVSQEGLPDHGRVVLLSKALWQARFHSDPLVVGRTLRLDGQLHEIVGVMPERFAFPEWAQLWTPVAFAIGKDRRDYRWLEVIGRLAPGVSAAQAQVELGALAHRLAAQYPASNADWGVRVRPLRDALMPQGPRIGMYFMLAAVGCVLLIVAANITTLMLVQVTSRAMETALRTALGANRRNVAAQFLTESLLLALAGAGLGLLLSVALNQLVVAAVPVQIPFWIHFELDGRILLFALGVSLLVALIFGLSPALRAARADPFAVLREGAVGSGGQRRQRLHRGTVAVEFALSVVLLVCALLMVKSFFRLQSANQGYNTSNVLSLRLSLTAEEHKAIARRTALLADVIRRVQALPGVQAAAAVEYLPLSRDGFSPTTLVVEGKPVPPGNEPLAVHHAATSGYLRTMEIPLVRGRDFTPREAEQSALVAVINESLAKRLWPGEDALGRRIRTVHTPPGQWLTVVGVVRDIDNSYRLAGLDAWPAAQVYVPYPQSFFANMTLVVRSAGDPQAIVSEVRDQVRAADPGVPIFHLLTMKQVLRQVLWLPRFWGQMFSAFGVLALLIAMVGVYGVTAYSIAQRKREIGIRMALGADRGKLLWMILRQGLAVALAGMGIGVVLALGATRGMAATLYGVSPSDATVYGSVLVVLGLTALVAIYLPARRTNRVNPVQELRG
ncbi:MAG TPA: ABC transporter permease [Thermoanaerobaculia bacterium]|nr:ABC transporter permease [Thermoanaerobaculia bacterium]